MDEIDRQIESMKEVYFNQEQELMREVGHFADPNDRGKDEEERYLASRLSQGELNRICKLETAKRRIKIALENGHISSILICNECGNRISKQRLWIQPTTTMCCECKSREEGQKRRNLGLAPGGNMWKYSRA